MAREAGIARNLKPISTPDSKTENLPAKKLRHDRRRARQRAKKKELNFGVLPARRENGTPDLTPHIASWDLTTNGRYLELGKGFIVVGKNEGETYTDKVKEYQEVEDTNDEQSI